MPCLTAYPVNSDCIAISAIYVKGLLFLLHTTPFQKRIQKMEQTAQPGTYSIEQQIHSLSLLSNAAFGVTSFNTITDLQGFVAKVITASLNDTTIQGFIGNDWQVIWGPVIWSHNPIAIPAIADNTMVLFYSPSQNQFVVAIAGTNIDSVYGWLTEDFGVHTNVTWQSILGNELTLPSQYADAAISQGAADGLSALLSMVDANSNTMLTVLQSQLASTTVNIPSGANVAVAGHSLGGALSPVLALYMQNLQDWNSNGKVTEIGVWATAGPTPGETNFASYYEYVIGSIPQGNNASLTYTSEYNTLDIVPHAWQSSTLEQIPFIYENNITQPTSASPSETITGSIAVGAALNALNAKGLFGIPKNTYTQVQPWKSLAGTFDTTTDDMVTSKLKHIFWVLPSALNTYSTYFTNFARFLAQLGFQHTIAYSGSSTNQNSLLNILDFSIEYQNVKTANNPSGQTEEQLHQAALSRAIRVNLFSLDEKAMERAKTSL
jgi:hypothetical protein